MYSDFTTLIGIQNKKEVNYSKDYYPSNFTSEGNTNNFLLGQINSSDLSSFLDFYNMFSPVSSDDEISLEKLYLNIKVKNRKEVEIEEKENNNIKNEGKEAYNERELYNEKKEENSTTKNSEKKMTKFLTRKKGRPNSSQEIKNNKERYIHGKQGTDNMIRKIQVRFITFIVKYVNYYIKIYISKNHPVFTDLEYRYKMNINKSFFNELKTKTIGDILKNKGSDKNNKGIGLLKPSNQEVFNLIYHKNDKIKNLLDTNYLDFFCKIYAYSLFYGERIGSTKKPVIPQGISNFDEFLKKEEKDDNKKIGEEGESYVEKLKEICKLRYK